MGPIYEINGVTEINSITYPVPYPQVNRYLDSRDPPASFPAPDSFSRLCFGKDPAMGPQKHQDRIEFLFCPPLFLPAFPRIDADLI